jgi:hypothetical protein
VFCESDNTDRLSARSAGDGKSDILPRSAGGAFAAWTMNGSAITAVAGVTSGGQAATAPAWQPQGSPADLPFG